MRLNTIRIAKGRNSKLGSRARLDSLKNVDNTVTRFIAPPQKTKKKTPRFTDPTSPALGSSQVPQPLTQVNHKRNKAPADGKLAALEKLLQPLFGFFAQLHHGADRPAEWRPFSNDSVRLPKRPEKPCMRRACAIGGLYGRSREASPTEAVSRRPTPTTALRCLGGPCAFGSHQAAAEPTEILLLLPRGRVLGLKVCISLSPASLIAEGCRKHLFGASFCLELLLFLFSKSFPIVKAHLLVSFL